MGVLEDGSPSPIEAAVAKQYGPEQPIERLPLGFKFFSQGNAGGALLHVSRQNIIGRFNENADPALIVQAANDHWCPRMGKGAGVV